MDNFRFQKQCSQGTARLSCGRAIFALNANIIFLALIFSIHWKKFRGKIMSGSGNGT